MLELHRLLCRTRKARQCALWLCLAACLVACGSSSHGEVSGSSFSTDVEEDAPLDILRLPDPGDDRFQSPEADLYGHEDIGIDWSDLIEVAEIEDSEAQTAETVMDVLDLEMEANDEVVPPLEDVVPDVNLADLAPCVPDCEGKNCGDDGCGHTCGTCKIDEICPGSGTCESACGDGICSSTAGEDCVDCQADCGTCESGCAELPIAGCGGCGCENSVCALDPFCCETSWDELCAGHCWATGVCSCTPNCQFSECGSDGCGFNCGVCPTGFTCADGQCQLLCLPDCADRDCGFNGCSGLCGVCEYGSHCLGGKCVNPSSCLQLYELLFACLNSGSPGCLDAIFGAASTGQLQAITGLMACLMAQCGFPAPGYCLNEALDGACKDALDGCTECTPACDGAKCGPDGCGSVCGDCANGSTCVDHQCVPYCLPDCTGIDCGSDGCGGSCGTCEAGLICKGGSCVLLCQPQCQGAQCGSDGCGGLCGECGLGYLCDDTFCQPVHLDCLHALDCALQPKTLPFSDAMACAQMATPQAYGPLIAVLDCLDKLGYSDLLTELELQEVKALCQSEYYECATDCWPECTGKVCGDDGCFGLCGLCPFDQPCVDGQCVGTCTPDCQDRVCGSDSCGGICGTCDETEYCMEGHCECAPDCVDKQCGEDGCGSTCGECQEGYFCDADGACSCPSDCCDRECGDDGCGGQCGTCDEDQVCSGSGQCLAATCSPDTESCSGADIWECNSAGTWEVQSTCPAGHTCTEGACAQCKCVPGETKCKFGLRFICSHSCKKWLKAQCPSGTFCSGGHCSPPCQPQCTDKLCGWDGCWSTCGSCPAGQACYDGVCLAAAPPCMDGNFTSWDGCTDLKVSEFQVNQFTAGFQRGPDIANLSDGGFVVVWYSWGQQQDDLSSANIVGRVFGSGCGPESQEIALNQLGSGEQLHPKVASFQNGGFVVVWESFGLDGSLGAVAFRVFGDDGQPTGPEFLANQFQHDEQFHPRVATLTSGRFVVAWDGVGPDDESGVFARVFQKDGLPFTDDFQVNDYLPGWQQSPTVESLWNGGFAVGFSGEGPQDPDDAFARFYGPGAPEGGNVVRLNPLSPGVQADPSLAAASDGTVWAIWHGETANGLHGISVDMAVPPDEAPL